MDSRMGRPTGREKRRVKPTETHSGMLIDLERLRGLLRETLKEKQIGMDWLKGKQKEKHWDLQMGRN